MNSTDRRFGLSLGLGLMVISMVLKIRGKSYIYLPPISIAIVLVSLIRPGIMSLVKRFLEQVMKAVTTVITWILLIFVFYLVIMPLGMFARIFRRKFLNLGFEDVDSYFEDRDRRKPDRTVYERQF